LLLAHRRVGRLVDGGRSGFKSNLPVAESVIVLRPQVPNPAPDSLRQGLADLVRYRHEYLSGDEKGLL